MITLYSRAEICQIFRWFFVKFKISKRHSEINWPLKVRQTDVTTCQLVFVCFLEESEDTKKTFQNYLTFSAFKEKFVLCWLLINRTDLQKGIVSICMKYLFGFIQSFICFQFWILDLMKTWRYPFISGCWGQNCDSQLICKSDL